jgi:hypothetical protein
MQTYYLDECKGRRVLVSELGLIIACGDAVDRCLRRLPAGSSVVTDSANSVYVTARVKRCAILTTARGRGVVERALTACKASCDVAARQPFAAGA